MSQDWLFRIEEGTCDFRCAAVIIRNGKVLLQRDGNEYAMIGGHVQVGETGEQAVVREFEEELGVKIRCQRMIWVEESFWSWKGKQNHTLSFYYLAEPCAGDGLPADGQLLPQRDNPRVEIGWVSMDELHDLTLYPAFIKQEIGQFSPGIRHFVSRE